MIRLIQDLSNKQYYLVFDFVHFGDLRNYIWKIFTKITSKQCIEILYYLLSYFYHIHKSEIVHADLHTENILRFNNDIPCISDMCAVLSTNLELGQIHKYDVMPYIAPEILQECAHTKESDIYVFGIIMWQLAAGKPPFGKEAFDAL